MMLGRIVLEPDLADENRTVLVLRRAGEVEVAGLIRDEGAAKSLILEQAKDVRGHYVRQDC